MVFSGDDHVLIKLLRRENGIVLKSLSWDFPVNYGRCQD